MRFVEIAQRGISGLLFFIALVAPALAADLGLYQVVNSAGLIKSSSGIVSMNADLEIGQVRLSTDKNDSELALNINGSKIVLYELQKGLAALDWTFDGALLLRRDDILALSGKEVLENVETWGASLDWPDLGKATMVLFRIQKQAFAGFLISTPEGKTIVRQMEFHPAAGPSKRRKG